MNDYTITYLETDDPSDPDNIKVKVIKAPTPLEAWLKVKSSKETWCMSIFEGRHVDLSNEIE